MKSHPYVQDTPSRSGFANKNPFLYPGEAGVALGVRSNGLAAITSSTAADLRTACPQLPWQLERQGEAPWVDGRLFWSFGR